MANRYVTVTELEDFLSCEWRWYARWRLNRVPRAFPVAPLLGTMVHEIFALHFAQPPDEPMSLDDAFDDTRAAWLRGGQIVADPLEAAAIAKAVKELDTYRLQIVGFVPRFTIDRVVSVEKPFSRPIVTIGDETWHLRGRPDLVVEVGGRTYHQQHKTVTGRRDLEKYTRFLARSMHETLYGWHLSQEAPVGAPYGGSIFDLIVKTKAKSVGDIPRLAQQIIVPLSGFDVERAVSRTTHVIARMVHAEKLAAAAGHWALLDNPKLDDGFFHNTLDGYFPALTLKASLDDPALFMDRRETYDEPTE